MPNETAVSEEVKHITIQAVLELPDGTLEPHTWVDTSNQMVDVEWSPGTNGSGWVRWGPAGQPLPVVPAESDKPALPSIP